MSRHNAGKSAPQVLKGLRLTTVARGLPYHAQIAQAHAQTLAAKPAGPLPTPGMTAVPAGAPAMDAPASATSATSAAPAELDAQVAVALAEAERAGYQQGLAGGRKDAQRELAREREALAEQAKEQEAARQAAADAALAAVEEALQTLDEAQRQHRERLAAQAAGLAFEALCRIVGRAGAVRETLLPLIETALDRWAGAARPTLRLSPDDLAALTSAVPEDRLQALLVRVEAVADASVRPMGALIEDADGGLDIGLDTQLRTLGEAWTRALAAPEDAA